MMREGLASLMEWSRIIRRTAGPFKTAGLRGRLPGSPGREPRDGLGRLTKPRFNPLRLAVSAKSALGISSPFAHPSGVHVEGRELVEDRDSPIELEDGTGELSPLRVRLRSDHVVLRPDELEVFVVRRGVHQEKKRHERGAAREACEPPLPAEG